MKRSFFALVGVLLLAALGALPASAQLGIADVIVPDTPRPTVGQVVTIPLQVTVYNRSSSAASADITAHVVALRIVSDPVSVLLRSERRRIEEVALEVDLTGTLPAGLDVLNVEVRVTDSGGAINDRRAVTIPVVQPLVLVDGGIITTIVLSAPAATTELLHLTLVTGGDDLRGGSFLSGRVLDEHGNPLSINPHYFGENRGEWNSLKNRSSPEWSNGSLHTVTIALSRPFPYGEIDRIELSLGQHTLYTGHLPCFGCTDDNWDLARIEVRADNADGTLLFEAEGDPLNRFTESEPTFILNLGGS